MRPILISIGELHVYSYHFMLFVGCMMGLWYVTHQIDHGDYPEADRLFPMFLWVFVAGILGSRIFNCIVFWEYYKDDPLSVLRFWEGGLVWYGGVIGGALVFLIYVPLRGLKYGRVADLMVPAVALALTFGRMGCLLVGCCYGRPTGEHYPWSITFDQGIGTHGTALYPTQLISALASFTLFLFLVWFKNHKRWDGQVVLGYLLIYPIVRFTIEFYRNDQRGFLDVGPYSFSESQVVSIPLFLLALTLYVWNAYRAEYRPPLREAMA